MTTFSLLSELIRVTAKPFGAITVGGAAFDAIVLICYCFFLFFYFFVDYLVEIESYFVSIIISKSLLTMLDKP